MSKPTLKVVRNEAQASAQIFLYGVVGDYWESDSPVTAINLLRQLALLSDFPIIHLHLNGPGGDVHEGLLICNIIKASKKILHTWNDGICASMMVPILCSVPAERRHAAKASLTMAHMTSTVAWGNAIEMRETADMLDKHDDVLAEIIADGLGITLEAMRAKWWDGKDHWMTAKEAEAEGFFTIEDYEISEIPENPTKQPLDKIAAFYNSHSNITQKTDMSILNFNTFKKVSALAKIAASDRTADHFKEANEELVTEGITGVTLVSDTDLQETITAAGKVPGLEKQVLDFGTEKTTLADKITALEKTISDQKKELGKPAEELEKPLTEVTDTTGGKKDAVVNAYETSFDREMAKFKAK